MHVLLEFLSLGGFILCSFRPHDSVPPTSTSVNTGAALAVHLTQQPCADISAIITIFQMLFLMDVA